MAGKKVFKRRPGGLAKADVTKVKAIARENNGFAYSKVDGGYRMQCEYCSWSFRYSSINARSRVAAHVATAKHIDKVANGTRQPSSVRLLQEQGERNSSQGHFNYDLALMFVHMNIPFNKVMHPAIKRFATKYLPDYHLPHESTLRSHLHEMYEADIKLIRSAIGDDPIYVMADETTDKKNRYILNIMVGVLNGKQAKSMLLASYELEKANQHTVSTAILRALGKLWPGDVDFDRIKLLVSDQVSYMIAAGRILKQICTDMMHVSCIVHALNLVAQHLKDKNSLAYKFMTLMSTYFKNSAIRTNQYCNITDLPMPPKLCMVRWNSFLELAFYYNTNYDKVLSYLNEYSHPDSAESKTLAELRQLTSGNLIKQQLLRLSFFEHITIAIDALQTEGLPMFKQLEILDRVRAALIDDCSITLENSLAKNPDFEAIQDQSQSQERLNMFKYAPLISVDVERSFSKHKNILSPHRMRFTSEHLGEYMVVHYNTFLHE